MQTERLISVARGEAPADLLLANARVINVFTGEIESGSVAIYDGVIAGIGDYAEARETVELGGKYVSPGFIDGHVHLESSMLEVAEYARAVVPRGTLAVVTDLHEIANVSGIKGLRYVLDSARGLPLDLFLMAPSCVPATNLETSGATLDSSALRQVLRWRQCIGLGEMMNFPGVLNTDPETLAKIGQARGRAVDGHAPALAGKDLQAYVAAGVNSDHESVALAEAREKLRLGMRVMIREGSSEKNLEALLPLVTDLTYPRCMFVVDDRSCVDLLGDGDIDGVLRKAIRLGLDPVRAVQMVTVNPAAYFQLDRLGAVAPGFLANLIVLDDLNTLKVNSVFYRGQLVAREGSPLFKVASSRSGRLNATVKIKPVVSESLKVAAPLSGAATVRVNVIEVVPGQIITRKAQANLEVLAGEVMPDPGRDILKLVVVERHSATGNVGVGFTSGFGLRRGALASSVAHDSHNIIAVGADDASLLTAIREIERLQGGLVAAAGTAVLASLPLPIAGLLSEMSLEDTVSGLSEAEGVAAQLGTGLTSPFSTLSFLALPVIPELRLTDKGLVDVTRFRVVDLLADSGRT